MMSKLNYNLSAFEIILRPLKLSTARPQHSDLDDVPARQTIIISHGKASSLSP